MGVWSVIKNFKIFEAVVIDTVGAAQEFELGKSPGLPAQLLLHLLQVT